MKTIEKNRRLLNIVLAIVIALGLWLYVVNVENPVGSGYLNDLPVQVLGATSLKSNDLMVTKLSKTQMNLKVTGKRKTLMKLSQSNVILTVDVTDITEAGEWPLTCHIVYPSNVSTDGVSIPSLDDLKITVTVENRESKEIPVRGEFIGTEEENCLAGEVKTNPDTLKIHGPSRELSEISYALAQVGGEKISDTLVETVNVVLMGADHIPANVEHVEGGAVRVEATVPVRKVAAVPLAVSVANGDITTTEDVQIQIKPAAITLAADEGEGTLPSSISLGEIDLNEVIGPTTYTLPITLPNGVVGWNVPKFASVAISFPALATRQIAVEDVTFENIPKGVDVTRMSQKLYVWVRGTAEAVDAVTAQRITVQVDLSKAKPKDGVQRFPAKLKLEGASAETAEILGNRYSVALQLAEKE